MPHAKFAKYAKFFSRRGAASAEGVEARVRRICRTSFRARNSRFVGLLPDSNIIQRVEIAEKVGNAPVSLLADDTAPSRNA